MSNLSRRHNLCHITYPYWRPRFAGAWIGTPFRVDSISEGRRSQAGECGHRRAGRAVVDWLSRVDDRLARRTWRTENCQPLQRDLQKTSRVEQAYFGPGDDSLGRGRKIPSVGIA
jgi:hypothetical protein